MSARHRLATGACVGAIAWMAAAGPLRAQGMDPSMPMPMPSPSATPKPAAGSSPPAAPKPAATSVPSAAPRSASVSASRAPVPAVSDADRVAAFPDVVAHAMHDDDVHSLVLFDRFEAWNGGRGAMAWEGAGWIGTDLDRLWIRSEGTRSGGRVEDGDVEVLYGHSVVTWWDLVAGVRHDAGRGPPQDYAAFGVMGLAPGKFEVEATAYAGTSGQWSARLQARRDVLLTNRWVLQPLVEANAFGRGDARRGIGAGLATVEAGLRIRYEVTRRFAPYLGIVRERAFGATAGFRRAEGQDAVATRVVAGFRFWF